MTTETTAPDSLYTTLKTAGYRVRRYSGRGMYGAYCVAVCLEDEADLDQVGAALGETFASVHTDGMGMGIVAYWPNVKWSNDYVEADDEY